MSTLDEYFVQRAPASTKSLILVSIDLGSESGRFTLVSKLRALLDVVRELQGEVGYAGVNSIRDYLLMGGVAKSDFEVQKLMKFAHRLSLIEEGQVPSTWRAVGTARRIAIFIVRGLCVDMRRRAAQAHL